MAREPAGTDSFRHNIRFVNTSTHVDVYSIVMITGADDTLTKRMKTLFATIAPMGTSITVAQLDDVDVRVTVAGAPLRVRFVGRGDLRGVQFAIRAHPRPDVIAASQLSRAAQEAITKAGINWADETGAARIEVGSIVIALSGRPSAARQSSPEWTPAAIGVAEAILAGTTPTGEAVAAATGHSLSTAVRTLAFLMKSGLLRAPTARGPKSGRSVVDPSHLLDEFSEAAHLHRPKFELRVGVLWHDPLTEIEKIGQRWSSDRIHWAVAGALSASLQAPYLTDTSSGVVYVDATSEIGMLHIARQSGLEAMEGGRLLLRPFPTRATMRLIQRVNGIWVTSWPRTYADLRFEGVRGEEAAEHFREVVTGG